jgi:hypothetical protein
VKKEKVSLFPDERVAIHAKLGSILKGGDPAEILLVIILLLALRPVPCCKACAAKLQKKRGRPKRPPSKHFACTGHASQANPVCAQGE